MNLLECVRVALEGIMTSKLRSFLTTLGIVIGIAAVIAVVAIGQGGRAVLMAEMEKIGTNIFAIYVDWRSNRPTTNREFNLADVAVIKDNVPGVTHLSPVNNAQCNIRGPKDQVSARVIGVSSDYAYIRKFNLKEGHFFTEEDDEGKRRVAVLGEALAGQVFGRTEALGSMITLNNTPFLVVGILAKNESALGFSENPSIYIPIQAWQSMFNTQAVHSLEGSAASKEQVNEAMHQAVQVLERRHQAPGRYASMSMEQEMQTANKITGIMTLIIGAIAGISLFVGGIGVMNIMLVSVTERTREIGIRMALGARRKDILVQFLIEAVMLCLLGGVIGMALGIGGAFLIAKLAKWPPLVSWWTALLAFAFSAAIGVVFGLLPANKAAKLNPIEALRRE